MDGFEIKKINNDAFGYLQKMQVLFFYFFKNRHLAFDRLSTPIVKRQFKYIVLISDLLASVT